MRDEAGTRSFSLWVDVFRWLAAASVLVTHAGIRMLVPLGDVPRPGLAHAAYAFARRVRPPGGDGVLRHQRAAGGRLGAARGVRHRPVRAGPLPCPPPGAAVHRAVAGAGARRGLHGAGAALGGGGAGHPAAGHRRVDDAGGAGVQHGVPANGGLPAMGRQRRAVVAVQRVLVLPAVPAPGARAAGGHAGRRAHRPGRRRGGSPGRADRGAVHRRAGRPLHAGLAGRRRRGRGGPAAGPPPGDGGGAAGGGAAGRAPGRAAQLRRGAPGAVGGAGPGAGRAVRRPAAQPQMPPGACARRPGRGCTA